MDQETLVKEEIDAGAELVDKFDKVKRVKAAFWLEPSEEGKWYLYIAAEGIPEGNLREGYREILRLIRDRQIPYLDAFRVKLIRPDDPLVRDVLEVQQRFAGRPPLPIHYGGSLLGGQSIEGAYFYALPIATPST